MILDLLLSRSVIPSDAPWLEMDTLTKLTKGTKVRKFMGHTYGCIGNGVAVSLEGVEGFFELPHSVLEVENSTAPYRIKAILDLDGEDKHHQWCGSEVSHIDIEEGKSAVLEFEVGGHIRTSRVLTEAVDKTSGEIALHTSNSIYIIEIIDHKIV